jgi:hypothetical protein
MHTDNEIDLFEQHVKDTNRHEKMDWLYESCSEIHMQQHFVTELVHWLEEKDFNEFYEWHCRNWDICSPEEMNARN